MNDDHGSGYQQPAGEESPDLAARSRTLLARARQGALATNSVRHPGWPFTSVMPYALADESPIFLISRMAIHTQNILKDDRASLMVTLSGGTYDPLSAERLTLMGRVSAVERTDDVRTKYLERHPEAERWVDFGDFDFYRFKTEDLYYVGGFGIMGWVPTSDFATAAPDPLAEHVDGIVEHMNKDHAEALRLIARKYASVEAATVFMTGCDRNGIDVRAETGEGSVPVRIPFSEEVHSAVDARRVLVAMTKASRSTA